MADQQTHSQLAIASIIKGLEHSRLQHSSIVATACKAMQTFKACRQLQRINMDNQLHIQLQLSVEDQLVICQVAIAIGLFQHTYTCMPMHAGYIARLQLQLYACSHKRNDCFMIVTIAIYSYILANNCLVSSLVSMHAK